MKNRQIYVKGGIIDRSKEGAPGGAPPLQWSNPLGNPGSMLSENIKA